MIPEELTELAKKGGQVEQEGGQISYGVEKTIIKALSKKKWKEQHTNSSCHKLSRPDQVILFRLRPDWAQQRYSTADSAMLPDKKHGKNQYR
nr:hypothetical protein BaRGS_021809 [Batillaria attramentaria]